MVILFLVTLSVIVVLIFVMFHVKLTQRRLRTMAKVTRIITLSSVLFAIAANVAWGQYTGSLTRGLKDRRGGPYITGDDDAFFSGYDEAPICVSFFDNSFYVGSSELKLATDSGFYLMIVANILAGLAATAAWGGLHVMQTATFYAIGEGGEGDEDLDNEAADGAPDAVPTFATKAFPMLVVECSSSESDSEP